MNRGCGSHECRLVGLVGLLAYVNLAILRDLPEKSAKSLVASAPFSVA